MDPTKAFPNWRGHQPWAQRVNALAGAGANAPDTLALFIELEALLVAHPPAHGYRPTSAFLAQVAALDAAGQAMVGRDFLLWQIGQFAARWPCAGFDPIFHGWFVDAFHNVLDQLESPAFVATVTRDQWQKNLALARLQLVPCCAQLVTLASGVPRSVAVNSGPAGLFHVLARCGGFAPFAEIHTHDPMVGAYFNPQGWEQCARLLARLLSKMPACRGVYATSWFFDPALGAISPKLAYLHDLPAAAGARFLRLGPDRESFELATAFPPRRKAWEAGTYQPCRYAIVWPRRALLAHYG